jgi:hypothetical protein
MFMFVCIVCFMYLKYMKDKQFQGFFKEILPDPRIVNRAEKIMVDLLDIGNVTVNKFCKTHTEKIGAYRMLANNSFDHNDLAEGVYRSCKTNAQNGHLLCIQDTTELNFTYHLGRIGKEDFDIGPITKNYNAGFFCHPVLIIDPFNQMPIGFSSIEIWNRSWDKLDRYERDYRNQDIKEKESYRWIKGPEKTKQLLSEATCLTIIGDRESDIYDEFASIPDHRTFLLIRLSINRKLYGGKQKLFEKLSSSTQKATYELDLPGNPKRTKRKAKMSLKYEQVKINHPINKPRGNKPEFVEMWAIEARELPESVPVGEEPVLWRLLTTHKIDYPADALKYIQWYSLRWLIEELFKIIKSKGLCIESAQLETGAGLKKLCILALQAALTIMTLKLSLNNTHKIKANLIFSEEQILFLKIYMEELEGKTTKLKNPYEKGSVQWASWGIARIGGWSGYISQGPPGYITLKNGLDRFNDKADSFIMVLKYLEKKDVYKD